MTRRIDFFAEVANEKQTSIREMNERGELRWATQKALATLMRDWGLVEPILVEYGDDIIRVTRDGNLERKMLNEVHQVVWAPLGFTSLMEVSAWLFADMPDEEFT